VLNVKKTLRTKYNHIKNMTISEQLITNSVVSLNELFPNFTNQFIKPFEKVVNPDIHNGMYLDFELSDREHKNKVNPILRLARPEDAEEIIGIYKELYNCTYPYKEMEDLTEVRKMIQDPSIQWIIYQDPSFNIAGCITYVLDFNNKRGYIRGFMLKKKYQGIIDITKAMIGSMLGMIFKYRNRIYNWYVENRTVHAKSQYSMWVCGIAPIGFYPNKDSFLGKVESDLMQILYDERSLRQYRSRTIPTIIPAVEDCYLYSHRRYNLGAYKKRSPKITLDYKKIKILHSKLKTSIQKDDFGYETIKFSFENIKSYFQFLYTPTVSNFEKTIYKVTSLEELFVFVQEFLKWKKELRVRYCEVFISAYHCEHQQIFYDAGLTPRGYVPSWKYNNKDSVFEDFILFNWYKGQISEKIHLIQEGWDLLDVFKFENTVLKTNEKSLSSNSFSKKILERKRRIRCVIISPKVLKSFLMIGLLLYLTMIGASILVAQLLRDFSLIAYTISSLGSIQITPFPLLFDGACMIGGCTTIVFNILWFNQISSYFIYSKKISTILKIGFLNGIIGSAGFILIGIFSLDRAGPRGIIHGIFAVLAFAGFIISIFISSHCLFLYSLHTPKFIGVIGLFGPLFVFLLNCIIITPIMEWLLLFSILLALIPQFFLVKYLF